MPVVNSTNKIGQSANTSGVKSSVRNNKLDKSSHLCYNRGTVKRPQHLNNVVVGNGTAMTKEQMNETAHMIEDGNWKQAIDSMVASGISREAIYQFCRDINFYPNDNFGDYLRTKLRRRSEKEALKSLNKMFGFN